MKKLFALAATALIALSVSACGIKAVEPQPVPLTGAHLGKMALEHTAIPNTLTVCGEEVTDFKTSLRNGFNYMAGEIVPITSPEEATSTLYIESLETTCLSDKFVDGSVITFKYNFTWKFKDGSTFSQSAVIPGASEDGVKDALIDAIENMYNFAFSAYLSKLNLGDQI
jgi:hypothetical protein